MSVVGAFVLSLDEIVVGVAVFQQFVDLREFPPSAFAGLGLAEGFTNHLHQVVQLLIGLVLLDECGYLLVVQPESLAFIEEVKHLGEELLVVEVVLEIDVFSIFNGHADETS